jgi:uncharacterized membrane protein SirB2
MMEAMKGNGVTKESLYAILVRKKDGSLRFCVDYRRLNDVTGKNSYRLPRIDDTLDTLTGVKLFSKLGLNNVN